MFTKSTVIKLKIKISIHVQLSFTNIEQKNAELTTQYAKIWDVCQLMQLMLIFQTTIHEFMAVAVRV